MFSKNLRIYNIIQLYIIVYWYNMIKTIHNAPNNNNIINTNDRKKFKKN